MGKSLQAKNMTGYPHCSSTAPIYVSDASVSTIKGSRTGIQRTGGLISAALRLLYTNCLIEDQC